MPNSPEEMQKNLPEDKKRSEEETELEEYVQMVSKLLQHKRVQAWEQKRWNDYIFKTKEMDSLQLPVVNAFITEWKDDPSYEIEEIFHKSHRSLQERPFERKKPIICYFCNEPGHIKPSCPRLTKGNYETVANLNVNSGNEDPFEKFKIKLEINGVERVCLRDSGASIDVCARSWINENDLLGEYVWLKSPLDDVCHCLPLAKIKIKTKGGEFYTKAAIKSNSSADEPYLLGNRTADLIESSEKGVQVINAVVTRSASKEIGTNLPTANSSPT
ncbi:retrovirus-related Pol polyprotein from transposon 17.6 [Trichonephila clavata]|uniref:Retrovirus-related Pol polyprotein from transposon 17.6 n=1 Tax=Trichonephila clavata TaxID=2740835 RepID=A0A8X6J8P3_TRICU|nr:retrovirus-related Pol polyprotein from transposon 17.6 [Trichonephila clavata]